MKQAGFDDQRGEKSAKNTEDKDRKFSWKSNPVN
jgi:hypothetical protein